MQQDDDASARRCKMQIHGVLLSNFDSCSKVVNYLQIIAWCEFLSLDQGMGNLATLYKLYLTDR